jgi:hypothetical protein
MSRLFDIVRHAPRAALLIALIASPVLMVPHVEAGDTVTIEAPAQKKTGAGFVILVSLQRSR